MAPPPGTGVTLTAAQEHHIRSAFPNVLHFYRRYADLAMTDQQQTGVPATFTLAQGGVESGWGRHMPGNMLFGVKADPNRVPPDQRQLVWTHEVVADPHRYDNYEHEPAVPLVDRNTGEPVTDSHGRQLYRIRARLWFRRFASDADSIAHHSRFLQTNRRYADAFRHTDNPVEFARAIAQAGYATGQAVDHGYERQLIAAIALVDRVAAYARAHSAEWEPGLASASTAGEPFGQHVAGDVR